MKKKKKAESFQWGRFLVTLFIMLILTTGTLIGMYYYTQFIIANNERAGFSEEDLNAPLPFEWKDDTEKPPLFIRPGPVPSFSCRLVWPINGTSNELDGYEGIGAVLNLTLVNEGISRVYVERIHYETGWGATGSRLVGYYVEPNNRRYIGHMMMGLSVPPPDEKLLTYSLDMDILVEGPTAWVRKEGLQFDTSRINLVPLSEKVDAPGYILNNPYYYDIINGMVREDREEISVVVSERGLDDGRFTIQDLVDAYQFVYDSIEYRSDPDANENEWISPMECLNRGAGDCEDYSILLGSVITSLGGNARVVITNNHAFTSVYIGKDDGILEQINDRFSIEIPFQIMEDELGLWLMIEPQAYLVFGWFPSDVRIQMGLQQDTYIHNSNLLGWSYEDSDVIYIVDIY